MAQMDQIPPGDMVNMPLFTRSLYIPGWLLGISEPSTVLLIGCRQMQVLHHTKMVSRENLRSNMA